jgi:hypothetical protein
LPRKSPSERYLKRMAAAVGAFFHGAVEIGGIGSGES